jgi:hypothetical protein
MQRTLLLQLLSNPLRFFSALRAHSVVHDKAMGLGEELMDRLSLRIQRSKGHGVDSSTDREAYPCCQSSVHRLIGINIPNGVLLSVFHFQGSTFFRALVNSHSEIGKLFSELYHLVFTPWRETAAEEHFLSLRTLLLHMYSTVALIRLKHYTITVGAVRLV